MTVQPDEGMQLLLQQMTGGPPNGPAAEVQASGHLDVLARLAFSLDQHAAQLQRYCDQNSQLHAWELCHLVEPAGNQAATAALPSAPLDDPDRWGPKQGWVWQLMGLSVTLLAGATQWSVWLDSPNDPTNLQMQQAVSGRWEPSDYFLMPQRRLVFTSVGGGITVSKWQAVEIDVRVLPGYLGLKTGARV